jgi:hypothetical protein
MVENTMENRGHRRWSGIDCPHVYLKPTMMGRKPTRVGMSWCNVASLH